MLQKSLMEGKKVISLFTPVSPTHPPKANINKNKCKQTNNCIM